MKRKLLYVIPFVLFLIACTSLPKEEIIIDLQQKGAEVSPTMFGIFFEEINHAGDGGLYAELVQNRSFEELEMPEGYHAEGDKLIPKPVKDHISGKINNHSFRWTTDPIPAWSLENKDPSAAQMKLTKNNPKFTTTPTNLEINIQDDTHPTSLINEGYWGMGITVNENYFLRTIIRTSPGYKGKIMAKLLSEKGELLASVPIQINNSGEWNDIKNTLVPNATDPKAKLALEFDAKGKIWIDYVSLFPENTFNKRPNGLRDDVARMLVNLKPAFIRWPGGCVVEGITLGNRFEWKKTLGDPAARPGEYSTWGYRCSYGFGYYEMLQFCEDINAKAMYVCNVGLGCQARMGDACSEDKIAYYLDDCLDAIEYAIGDEDTKWGARRKADGHPAPFPLQYVEIGNENWGAEYDKRFDIFYKAIKEKYPQLTLISNHGLGGTGNITQTDMIDPHWYVSPSFFYRNSHIFDDQPRGKYTVYVGEYACNQGVGGGNMTAALSEAAFISGMERNGDLVKMASYAPLFENRHDREWPTNLIWIDNDKVVGRTSYYVQQMAVSHRPTYNIKNTATFTTPAPIPFKEGKVGFGSWETQVEYKDIQITSGGQTLNPDITQADNLKGDWKTNNGVLSQSSPEQFTKYFLNEFTGNDYTLEFKARKTGGKEGFFLYYGLTDNYGKGYLLNIAGWGNTATATEEINGDGAEVVGTSVNHSIENDKWYNVKLVVTPTEAKLYMDDQLIITNAPSATPLQFISSGYDENTGEVIVKVVNGDSKPCLTSIRLEGAREVEKTGKVISLTAANGEEENSFEEPTRIAPQENEFKNFNKMFDYEFPPFSYTVLRIKVIL